MNYLRIIIFVIFGVVGTQGDPTDCIDYPTGTLLKNPRNAATFFKCVNGFAILLQCSEELQWNDENKRCEEEFLVRRNNCEGVPETEDVLLPNPVDCGSYIQCVHQKPVVRPCPTGLHWSVEANRCEWPEIANCHINSCENVPETEDVLLPNPKDCGSYIQCVHQKPVVRPCPAGLHWSVAANRCEWPEIANCNNTYPVF